MKTARMTAKAIHEPQFHAVPSRERAVSGETNLMIVKLTDSFESLWSDWPKISTWV